MDAQGQLRLRDVIEGFDAHAVIGEGQIADGFAEKDLVADGAGSSHGQNVFGIGLDDHAGDAEIDQRPRFAEFLFHFDLLGISSRRHGVRHVDNGSYAAAHGRGGAGVEIFFVGHARFSELNMAVEQPR